VPEARIACIPNGIALPPAPVTPAARAQARETLGLPADAEVVAYVGRLMPQKAPDLLLSALRYLAQRPACHLLVVGQGFDEEPRFRAARQAAPRLRLTGRVLDAAPYLTAADVLILPSRGEGMSNTLLEAMALGVPCVASGLRANQELLGDAGLLAPPEDGEAIGVLAGWVLDNPVLRQELAARGRRRAAAYDLAQVAARYEGLYEEMVTPSLTSSGPPPRAPKAKERSRVSTSLRWLPWSTAWAERR
jgi:glycosyltransferase involved in cell wall biosynthesis